MPQAEDKKTQNQRKLVQLMTDFVTSEISDTDNGKKYLKTLGEREPQKAINKLGSTHAEIKREVEQMSPDDEKYNTKEYEVVQAIDTTLKAYNGSKKDEEVAIGVIASMSQQTSAHDAHAPKENVEETTTPKGPRS